VLAELDPAGTGDRETDVIPLLLSRLRVRAAPKSSVMPSSPSTGATCGQGPRPARQLRPRRPPGAGFSSSSSRSAPMTTGGGRPADGIVRTHAARKLLALDGVSPDQQAHDQGSHSAIRRDGPAAGERPEADPDQGPAHAKLSEAGPRILMQRSAFPFVISNGARGPWLSTGIHSLRVPIIRSRLADAGRCWRRADRKIGDFSWARGSAGGAGCCARRWRGQRLG
jgi:hypothetical protein